MLKISVLYALHAVLCIRLFFSSFTIATKKAHRRHILVCPASLMSEPTKKAQTKKRGLAVSLFAYCFNSYPVLRPPASVRTRMPLATRSCRSRRAVSVEHLFIFAHFDDVSLPSKPSHNILTMRVCLSFITVCLCDSQNDALCSVRTTVSMEVVMASFSLSRNHNNHSLMSSSPFCVLSNTS